MCFLGFVVVRLRLLMPAQHALRLYAIPEISRAFRRGGQNRTTTVKDKKSLTSPITPLP